MERYGKGRFVNQPTRKYLAGLVRDIQANGMIYIKRRPLAEQVIAAGVELDKKIIMQYDTESDMFELWYDFQE